MITLKIPTSWAERLAIFMQSYSIRCVLSYTVDDLLSLNIVVMLGTEASPGITSEEKERLIKAEWKQFIK